MRISGLHQRVSHQSCIYKALSICASRSTRGSYKRISSAMRLSKVWKDLYIDENILWALQCQTLRLFKKASPPHVKKTIRCKHYNWNTKHKPTYLIHLLKAHNQRHLLVLPPQPGMDIAGSDIISPRGVPRNMQPLYRIAKMTATTGQGSHSLSEAAKEEDQSSTIPNLDPRVWFSHGCPSLTLKERNDIACESLTLLRDLSLCWHVLAQCANYWLDKSKLNATCTGPPKSNETRPATAVSPQPNISCPFSMTLGLDTALLKPTLRVRPPYLFYCFTLSTRCLHCDTVNFGPKLGALGTRKILFAARKVKQICQAKKCRLSSGQNVGIYCDMHYMIIPYLC